MGLLIRLAVVAMLAVTVAGCDRCGDFLGQPGKACRSDSAK